MKFDKLFFRHEDAVALGSADKAIILEFVRWSIHSKEAAQDRAYMAAKYFMDDHWWMQDSYEAWHARMPWVGKSTLRRYIEELCESGYLIKKFVNGQNGRAPNFYRANPSAQFGTQSPVLSSSIGSAQFEHAPVLNSDTGFLYTKNQTKTHTKNPDEPIGSVLDLPPISPLKVKQPKYLAEDLATAKSWLEYALGEMNWKKPNAGFTPEKFAEGIARLRKTANLDHNHIDGLLDFVKRDEFWRKVSLSPVALLKRSSNGNLKIDNLLLAMKGALNTKTKQMYDAVEEAFKEMGIE